jgi:glutaredoxin-like protein
MALLNDQIRKDVREMLADVENPVKLTVFTQSFECEYCKETRELVEEVAALSDSLSVEVFDFEKNAAEAESMGVDKIPAIAITGAKDYGIRLYGIPSGYEFGSLLEAIKLVSDGDSGLAAGTKQVVAKLKEPVHIQVFITPT